MSELVWYFLGGVSASLFWAFFYSQKVAETAVHRQMRQLAEDDAKFWREQSAQYKQIATSFVFPTPAKPKAEQSN